MPEEVKEPSSIAKAEMQNFFKKNIPVPKEEFTSEMHEFMKHKAFNWEAKKDKEEK